MRISDWSSDVCSSDLQVLEELLGHARVLGQVREGDLRLDHPELGQVAGGVGVLGAEGRAEGDRQSVVSGRGVSVRVDLGGRRIIKKEKQTETMQEKYSI